MTIFIYISPNYVQKSIFIYNQLGGKNDDRTDTYNYTKKYAL